MNFNELILSSTRFVLGRETVNVSSQIIRLITSRLQ